MAWYQKAPDTVRKKLDAVLKKHFKRLIELNVQIDLLIAYSANESPAILIRGNECAGCVRIVGPRERAMGLGDAVITLNGDLMTGWSERRIAAVLHHEITHLEPVFEKKTGLPKTDDLGRPRLKLRNHDFEFGWFADTAQAYGVESYECEQAKTLLESCSIVQMMLPGFEAA